MTSTGLSAVSPTTGYPRKFERICRGDLRTRYLRYPAGPPVAFLAEITAVNEEVDVAGLEAQFPTILESERASTSTERFRDALWNQLDALRGFDPYLLRVDKYGNVLYRHAETGSPVYGQIDHWFPVARGGLSVASNLCLIQWEANKHKSDQLEFLVPWFDLQCGVHFTRFLSTYASSDALLRNRMFTLLFGPEGETHELVTGWAPPNLSRSALIAQAIISMDPASSSNKGPGAVRSIKKGEQRRSTNAWSAEETAQLRAAFQKHSMPGQASLSMQQWRDIHASAEFSCFRTAKREPKDLYDKWRNLLKGGTTRRSGAASRSGGCVPHSPHRRSPAPARQLFRPLDATQAGTPVHMRRASWVQPPSHVPAAGDAPYPQKQPRGSRSVPRPPLGQRDQNAELRLEAAFAHSCRLSYVSSSSDDSDGEQYVRTGSLSPYRAAQDNRTGALTQAQRGERHRSQGGDACSNALAVSQKVGLSGPTSGVVSEQKDPSTVSEQELDLRSRLAALEAQGQQLTEETSAAAQRREDLLCEVALVEQETADKRRTLTAQHGANEALAQQLARVAAERDAVEMECARARVRQRALEGKVQAGQEEAASKGRELSAQQKRIQIAQKEVDSAAEQRARMEEALEAEEETLQELRHTLAATRREHATVRAQLQACKEEQQMLEAKAEGLKDSCLDVSMRLELDLPEVRRWQIRADDAEAQACLARQKEAAFKQRLRKLAEKVGALTSALSAAQEAARVAEQEKRREEEEVARLQSELRQARERRLRAAQASEELRLQRSALAEQLRAGNEEPKGPEKSDNAIPGTHKLDLGPSTSQEQGGKEHGPKTSDARRLFAAQEGAFGQEADKSAAGCEVTPVLFATESETGPATGDASEGAAPARKPEAAVSAVEQALQEGSEGVQREEDRATLEEAGSRASGGAAAWPGLPAAEGGEGDARGEQEQTEAQTAGTAVRGCELESEEDSQGSDVASVGEVSEAPTVVLGTQADFSPLGGQPSQRVPPCEHMVVDLAADSPVSTYSSAMSSRSSSEAGQQEGSHAGAGVQWEAGEEQVTADVKVREWLDAMSAVAMQPTGGLEDSRMTQALDDMSTEVALGKTEPMIGTPLH